MKRNLAEDIFFLIEVLFLLSICVVALYNIWFEKSMIMILVILGGYILSVKGLRRVFTEKQKLKTKKAQFLTLAYLGLSTYIFIHLSFTII